MVLSDLQTIKDQIIYREIGTVFLVGLLFQNIIFYFQVENLDQGRKKETGGGEDVKGRQRNPHRNSCCM